MKWERNTEAVFSALVSWWAQADRMRLFSRSTFKEVVVQAAYRFHKQPFWSFISQAQWKICFTRSMSKLISSLIKWSSNSEFTCVCYARYPSRATQPLQCKHCPTNSLLQVPAFWSTKTVVTTWELGSQLLHTDVVGLNKTIRWQYN